MSSANVFSEIDSRICGCLNQQTVSLVEKCFHCLDVDQSKAMSAAFAENAVWTDLC